MEEERRDKGGRGGRRDDGEGRGGEEGRRDNVGREGKMRREGRPGMTEGGEGEEEKGRREEKG